MNLVNCCQNPKCQDVINRKNSKYCGNDCRKAHYLVLREEKKANRVPRVLKAKPIVKCFVCKEEFEQPFAGKTTCSEKCKELRKVMERRVRGENKPKTEEESSCIFANKFLKMVYI